MDGSSHLLAGAICETVFLPNRRNIWTLWGRLTTGCLPELGKLPQKSVGRRKRLPHGTSASRMLN